jgi:hypothetical protein
MWSGAGHGPEANLEATAVYSVRKCMAIGLEYFWNHTEALEAAGLSE